MNHKQLRLVVVVMLAALSVAGLAAGLCSVGDATADGVFDVADVTVFRRDLAGLGPGVSPDCSAPLASTTLQLVGFTDATFPADTGVLGFTLACQAEFAGSRMCTSNEAMNTLAVPSGLVDRAWVRPSFVPISTGVSGTKVHDASGVRGSVGLSCEGWSVRSASGQFAGLNVGATGRFGGGPCDAVRSVACCAPVP